VNGHDVVRGAAFYVSGEPSLAITGAGELFVATRGV
jgi:hypothetical protein